jgi:hypothetical protein
MTFWKWLAVLLRLAGETIILGFTFHHAHWSVAVGLAWLTANLELERLMKYSVKRDEEGSLTERNRMIERLRNLT